MRVTVQGPSAAMGFADPTGASGVTLAASAQVGPPAARAGTASEVRSTARTKEVVCLHYPSEICEE